MNVRKAMFAGSWYPASASGCEKKIKNFLQDPNIKIPSQEKLVGGIVPHAGWYFSGSIACNVIHFLKADDPPDVFLIFGMHLHSGSPSYIMTEGAWETPFGEIHIEEELASEITRKFSFKLETAEDFTQDNTIEIQLPFIKYFFPEVKIVPIGVPPTTNSFEIGKTAVEIAVKLGLRVKIVGSTDLTHYGLNYGFIPKGTGLSAAEWVRNENDRRVIDAMLSMDPDEVVREALTSQNACCAGAAATAIAAGIQLGAKRAELIAYSDRKSVV